MNVQSLYRGGERDVWEGRLLTKGCNIYGDQKCTWGGEEAGMKKGVQGALKGEKRGRLKLREN